MSSQPIISSVEPRPNTENVADISTGRTNDGASARSGTHKTSSSATVRARKTAAEALFMRRQLEREQELAQLQRKVEEYELQAELAQIDAEESRGGSTHISIDRTQTWVTNLQNNLNNGGLPAVRCEQQDSVTPPGHTVPPVTTLGTAPLITNDRLVLQSQPHVHQLSQVVPSTSLPLPSRDIIRDNINLSDSPMLLQAIADTATAAKTLAISQSRHNSHKTNVELFTFSGNTLEWLQFKRLFDSTKLSFSPTENIGRLHKALRGPAREVVASLLISSDEPEEIMTVLEQNFACPEMIVFREVTTLKSLPRLGQDLKELCTVATKVRNSLHTIRLLNLKEYLFSPELYYTILGKLNPALKLRWNDYASQFYSDKLSKLEVLSNFLSHELNLHNKFSILPDMGPTTSSHSSHFKRERINSITHTKKGALCMFCSFYKKVSKQTHSIKECNDFKALSIDDRWRWLNQAKVCYRCLKGNSHQWSTCRSPRCGVDGCSFRHHQLLHGRQTFPPSNQTFNIEPDNNNTACPAINSNTVNSPSLSGQEIVMGKDVNVTVSQTFSFQQPCNKQLNSILLKVVPVTVSGSAGSYDTYALLDDGSTATMIDSEVAARIGAVGPQELISINGVGGLKKNTMVSYVDFEIKGKYSPHTYRIKGDKAMSSLGLHCQSIPTELVSRCSHLTDLVDIVTYDNAKPTILIGAEHWYLSITKLVRRGKPNDPVACFTDLGWLLYGGITSKSKPISFVNHCTDYEAPDCDKLDCLIKAQYRLDSLGIFKNETLKNALDKRAEEILNSTSRRLPSGRFEVGLPWRDNIMRVPDSYPQALSRFLNLEKQMDRNAEFANAYQKFIDNMIEKGYAELCDSKTYYNNSSACKDPSTSSEIIHGIKNIRIYLPHFGVFHPQKCKLRVVHDAAARNDNISLNSLLLPGPDLLQSLLGILFRFREGRIALTADIKEMFPQIRVREQDRDALRFLWRDRISATDLNKNKGFKVPIKEYRMTSVIFGASSSPFTALYIKNKNAKEFEQIYPNASDAIINDHYMDDYLGSLDEVEEAAHLAKNILKIHSAARFEMRGWVSNCDQALTYIPVDLRAPRHTEVDIGSNTSIVNIRVLGISWDPQEDHLVFRIGKDDFMPKILTKRTVLSRLMRIYDPLGLLGPIIVKGRILFQQTWRTNIGWDTDFSPNEVSKWTEWFKEISEVSDIRIPRWYASVNNVEPEYRELHVFSDASELAFNCVAYWRFVNPDGSIQLALVSSKAKVSPLKPMSIPRLELQAALIASRLGMSIVEKHRKKPRHTYFWTDSTTVLSWLRSDARTFKPFVAHRVGEICENSNINDWKWVPSGFNVADDATRIKPIILNNNSRWFTGPDFLYLSSENWPKEPEILKCHVTPMQNELKNNPFALVGHLFYNFSTEPTTANFEYFSDWLRLVRATARVLHIVDIFRNILIRLRNSKFVARSSKNISTSTTLIPLTAELIKAAERQVLKRTQLESFPDELQCIAKSQALPRKSRLLKLSPVLDADNMLRMAGRIKAVEQVNPDVKCPILLDGRHRVVRLLVQHYHRSAGHANNEMVINEMRQKYWIIHLRPTVRTVAKKCLFCQIKKMQPVSPATGDLPLQRLAHHRRPFSFTGVDYFGPINITVARRHEKRYVALYTCMTSRAVHLEIVHNLSADAAIMSLRRFIARRGLPNTIYSDNGTAFTGANRLLKQFYGPGVEDFVANKGIKWSFIPAAAPFFGGCWERLIRSIKSALSVVLRERAPKEETLCTLLMEAEAIVNARPLTHVSVNSDDEDTLTPFHFLIGTSSTQSLPNHLDDTDLVSRMDYKKALRLADHFWNRWVREILPVMQIRQPNMRTTTKSPTQPKIGDLVLIVDESLPRGTWPRGRLIATHPGKDGIVRVVDVATKGGTLRRPVRKIVILNT